MHLKATPLLFFSSCFSFLHLSIRRSGLYHRDSSQNVVYSLAPLPKMDAEYLSSKSLKAS